MFPLTQVECAGLRTKGREVERGLPTEEQNLPKELKLLPPGASPIRASVRLLLLRWASQKGLVCIELLGAPPAPSMGSALALGEQKFPLQERYPLPTARKQRKYLGIKTGK